MGLGRFGPGGCCTCDGGGIEPPTHPPLPPQWSAGDCRHCGLCEQEPSQPYGPDEYCPYELTDGFDTEKRMPYVPYWVYGPRNGYGMVYDMPGKYLTYWNGSPYTWFGNQCPGYPWTSGSTAFYTGIDGYTVSSGAYCPGVIPLTNNTSCQIPATPVSRAGENFLAVQSPNRQTDVLPLRFEHRIKFNISREALPKWLVAGLGIYGSAFSGVAAGVFQRFGQMWTSQGSEILSSGFGWNDEMGYGYGSMMHALSVGTVAEVDEAYFIPDLHPYYCTPYLSGTVQIKDMESKQYVTIQREDGIQAKWGENELGFVVIHLPDPSDNRQMLSTFEIYLNGAVVKRQTFSMSRPGYKRPPHSAEQEVKQFFCSHSANCVSEYQTLGFVSQATSAMSGWYSSQDKETVRRAVWWDDWYALASRP